MVGPHISQLPSNIVLKTLINKCITHICLSMFHILLISWPVSSVCFVSRQRVTFTLWSDTRDLWKETAACRLHVIVTNWLTFSRDAANIPVPLLEREGVVPHADTLLLLKIFVYSVEMIETWTRWQGGIVYSANIVYHKNLPFSQGCADVLYLLCCMSLSMLSWLR